MVFLILFLKSIVFIGVVLNVGEAFMRGLLLFHCQNPKVWRLSEPWWFLIGKIDYYFHDIVKIFVSDIKFRTFYGIKSLS